MDGKQTLTHDRQVRNWMSTISVPMHLLIYSKPTLAATKDYTLAWLKLFLMYDEDDDETNRTSPVDRPTDRPIDACIHTCCPPTLLFLLLEKKNHHRKSPLQQLLQAWMPFSISTEPFPFLALFSCNAYCQGCIVSPGPCTCTPKPLSKCSIMNELSRLFHTHLLVSPVISSEGFSNASVQSWTSFHDYYVVLWYCYLHAALLIVYLVLILSTQSSLHHTLCPVLWWRLTQFLSDLLSWVTTSVINYLSWQ